MILWRTFVYSPPPPFLFANREDSIKRSVLSLSRVTVNTKTKILTWWQNDIKETKVLLTIFFSRASIRLTLEINVDITLYRPLDLLSLPFLQTLIRYFNKVSASNPSHEGLISAKLETYFRKVSMNENGLK